MSNTIRVLQVVTHMNRGGLETMLMNYYCSIDRKKIQFDFLTHRPYDGDYGEKIKRMDYKGFTQRIIEVEKVLLHTLWVKRNAGRGTPVDNSLV